MQNKKISVDKQSLAAIVIQKNWRRYAARRITKKLLKRQKKKVMTAGQLLNSQRTYCQNLQFVIKEVMGPSKKYIPDIKMHSSPFGNIEDIYILHKNFLEQFEKVMKNFDPHKTKLSQVLMNELFNKKQFKKAYTNYCYNYKFTDQAIKYLVTNNPSFNEHLRTIGLISVNLTLESYMIKPVQRLCKYGLMVDEYTRNMEKDHIDHSDMEKTSALISKLVHETNNQVEQFLMRERLHQLRRLFPNFFAKISSSKKPRMYYQTKAITLMDVVKQQEVSYKSMALFQNSVILFPKNQLHGEPTFVNFLFIRELQNHKYYKHIVQLISQNRYSYIQFREEKDKKQFMRILNQKMMQNSQPQFTQYVKVSILGTETRQSFFASYTVYIVNIDDNSKVSTIYPRFKDLLKVQDFMISKGMRFDPPLLAKESILATLKSKTIQKRKLTIQEFLERVLNVCELNQIKQIQQILGVSQISSNTIFEKATTEVEEVSVQLPNLQKLKVLIPVHESKIRDLKILISEQMGMESTNQFQIFQIRNKSYNSKKLLYDDQPVKKIYDQQKQSSTSINPFRDTFDYLYTRHYYLSRQEEEELYKTDQVRAELELSVIHSEILNYKLEQEVMLTFMCLFALYIQLPVQNSEKLNFFIKEICKKAYKVSEEEFMIYYNEVKRMVSSQDTIAQSLPIVIIKIVANSHLYQCQQFDAEVHHKIYSQLRKVYPNVQEKLILGLHPNAVYLVSCKDRGVLVKFSYSQLTIVQTHPNAVVFQMMHTQLQLILKTLQAFQISKIFEIYKNKS